MQKLDSVTLCHMLKDSPFFLARSLAPRRYGVPNLASNGKNTEIWPKQPTLTIPHLHRYGEQ